MAVSKNRKFAQIANDVAVDGTLTAAAISSDVTLGGATIYASRSNLPTAGNTAGDQAFTTDTNRLYIWNGSGWYNVALLNVAPSIQSVTDSDSGTTPFSLATDGTATTITITAADSDGDPITYTATADSNFGGLANISQDSSVFTITPLSVDSATTTSGTITFTATDGINIASSGIQTFRLNFIATSWPQLALSLGTASTGVGPSGLQNDTFVDRSTNAHTITPTGTPFQSDFHPYLDYWSIKFNGSAPSADWLNLPSTTFDNISTTFTMESWVYINAYWVTTQHTGGNEYLNSCIFGKGDVYLNFGVSNDGRIRLYHWNGSAQFQYSTGTVPLNEWHHIAAVVDNGSITFYIDGVSAGTGTWYGIAAAGNGTPAYIGVNGNNDFARYFKGYLSNPRFVDGTAIVPLAGGNLNLEDTANTEFLFNSNQLKDVSSNNIAVTPNGAVSISSFNPFGQESEYDVGENKGSAYLDGATLISYSPPAIGTGDFTVEGWFHTTNTASQTLASDVATNTTNSTYFTLALNASSQLSFQTRTSSQTITTSTETAIKGSWNHFIAQRESNVHTIWLNGVRTQGADDGGKNLTKSEIIFGGWNFTNYEKTGDNLYLSDIKFSKSAVYSGAGASIALPTEPVGNTNAEIYLPMDNAGIFDITSSNNTLTLNGVVASTTQTKFANTAIYFDGSNDTIEIASGGNNPKLIFNNSNWTMEAWVYKTSAVSGIIFSQSSVSCLTSSSNNALQLQIFRGGNRVLFISANNVINLNTWHHVALTCDGSDYRIWVDGTQVATGAISSSYPWSQGVTTQPFVIGRYTYNNTNYWPGYMENIQLNPNVCKYTTTFTPPDTTQGRTYQAES